MDVIMPQLGETVLEGSILTWYKRPGELVKSGEPLFEVETDKVTTEIPAPASGVLSEILVEPGVSVAVGTRLAVIGDAAPADARPAVKPAAAGPWFDYPVGSEPTVQVPAQSAGRLRLSPVVRRLVREHNLDPTEITGTGRQGRITREDVLARISAADLRPDEATAAVLAGQADDQYAVPLSRIRKITAAHMVRSKSVSPHVLQAVEVDFHNVQKARRKHGPQWHAQHGHSLTYLPFVAWAVCRAIEDFPHVNARFGNDELIVSRRVNLGIAVDLDFQALVVGVVRDATARTVGGLATEIDRLATDIRKGVQRPDDQTGSTYTISNSGSFGTYFSAPIINQPQVAILSLDGIRKRPVVIEDVDGDSIAIRPVGVLAQCFDHRAFDGAYSAAFLRCVKDVIEGTDWEQKLG